MQLVTVVLQPNIQAQWQLTMARFDEWFDSGLLSIRWWVLLALFFTTAFIWWKIADKSRLNEIMLFTAVIILFIIILDELGEELTLWYYTIDIIPLFPPITAIDISCLPLAYMLVYQYTRSWKSFIITTVVMAAVFCFVAEPLFVWAGVYRMLTWKSYYGFPIYIFIGIASKSIVNLACSPASKRMRSP